MRTKLFKQVVASTRDIEPGWEPLVVAAVETNAALTRVIRDRSILITDVKELVQGVLPASILSSTFARFENHWCLAVPLIIDDQVGGALIFVAPGRFTAREKNRCLEFAEQCQRSVSSRVAERSLTDRIDELTVQRRRVQLDDPLGLTQRRTGAAIRPRSFGDIRLSVGSRTARRDGRDLELTVREFDLLDLFLQSPGTALSRAQILSTIWHPEENVVSNVLSVTVKNLRKKLEAGNEPRVIHSIRGIGYILGRR
ncbi:MAG: winged helix-turn-helix domain-containing protein [Dehalococcoidia bacterium]|nr:winged helix-turn-helix domain-containing protein [Dehalococcoidia bacterium]